MYAKFSLGPIVSPRPGPTFDKDVAAPDIDVINLNQSKIKAKTIREINQCKDKQKLEQTTKTFHQLPVYYI